ncbi:hypothetical protein ACJX0J_041549, partial [Zea mays]
GRWCGSKPTGRLGVIQPAPSSIRNKFEWPRLLSRSADPVVQIGRNFAPVDARTSASMGSVACAPERDAMVWKVKSFPGGKGIQVRYLKIIEKSGYQALPWAHRTLVISFSSVNSVLVFTEYTTIAFNQTETLTSTLPSYLASAESYMILQLAYTKEYIDGQFSGNLGEILI